MFIIQMNKYQTYQHILIIITLLIYMAVGMTSSRQIFQSKGMGIKTFGMNKPHLLFHLGTRQPISVNFGFGYWLNNQKDANRSYFTRQRLWYENKANGLYVNMVCHDGESHVHQQISDHTYGVQTDIKYQLRQGQDGNKNYWQEKILIQKDNKLISSENIEHNYDQHTVYWFSYMTVENNDPNQVDHKDYSTPITFEVTKQQQNEVEVNIDYVSGNKEFILIKSKQKVNVFGFSMNISESYDIRSTIAEIKHLIQLKRYKNITRKSDKKLVQWEDNQVKLMKKKQWLNKKYVVLIFYGELSINNEIFITNQTSSNQFDSKYFYDKSQYLLDQKYFPMSLYPDHSHFLQHMIFNLYGGQAFYYGILYTQNSLIKHEADYSYTFTPSRLIFPRGFLWDDGFHMSVAVHHKPKLVLNILHNWMRKIDLFGWIGREQIRGYQMSSLMPELKFVYQDIFEMNPPTLIMPILTLIDKSQNNELNEAQKEYFNDLLTENYWKLQKWYRYLVKTQSHYNLMEAESINKTIKYRWRCKDDCQRGNFMGSGLDDYPRISQHGQISKQHIDLVSWIYFFSDGLQKIAGYLNQTKSKKFYTRNKEEIREKMLRECLDENDLLFKDVSVAGKAEYIDKHVSKIGYINLFPFFTGMLKEEDFDQKDRSLVNKIFEATLSVMPDEKQLLSEDGIRSLSISDPLYGTEDNYWRGAVWMPINYMILRSCKKYYWHKPGIQEFYQILRQRLIHTVKQNYGKSGYLFENYHGGSGNRGYPFYGWTTLLVNIISQNY